MILELIIKSFLVGWIVTRFSPLRMILDELPDNLVCNVIKLLLTCSKCVTFWSSLILFHDIWISIISTFIMVMYERTIGHWEKKVIL